MMDELKSAPLLASLSQSQLQRVSRHAVRVRLDAEQMLFSQGDPARRFYLLLEGQMQLFRLSPGGAQKVIELVSPGQTFAEALMFLNAPRYPVSAAALAPSVLISLDADDFARMLRESVDTCFLLLGALSQRLRGLVGEIDSLTLHSASGRLARYLLGKIPPQRRAMRLDVRKGVLASRLSIKPETFSRVVRDLSQRGIIEVHGSEVVIADREALVVVAELQEPGVRRSWTV
ncbi:Crp/Fnr family transcriptional regulator [Thiohalocapsa marina]|uniref:Crp/Fnr family transcriptional regulator n=1 Tax=Thiohalocapsa marina TaxID=424902 RepID=A0A5M8FVI0_9GAMM|nr:Crp/Fnr family transcriptional regulator [Thiohalocapsa marina]KAA6187806.1 Crp/Fnr family transcriptional regulator [Thiohalocapsa marina]